MSFLIDPTQVINFNRTDSELETFWLFCLVVAGKTAKTQARLLNNFLTDLGSDSPFVMIGLLTRDELLNRIKLSRLGQFNRLTNAFRQSLTLDLRNATVDDLENITGVGPKTARMFLMMSRPNQQFAALDTHILKYLGSRGITVPKTTPSGRKYQELEKTFLKFAHESKMTVAEFDLMIWKKASGNVSPEDVKENRTK